MIDYIHQMCRQWGEAKRRLHGIPTEQPKSLMGRIKDEGLVGAAIRSSLKPESLEVMLGEALQVAVAIRNAIDVKKLTERQYEILFMHYVVRAPVKVKHYKLGLSRHCYYERLSRAHHAIMPWLGGDKIVGTNVP